MEGKEQSRRRRGAEESDGRERFVGWAAGGEARKRRVEQNRTERGEAWRGEEERD